MGADSRYVEFRTIEFSEGTVKYHYRFALDENAAAKMEAFPHPLPKDKELVELLEESGAVLHDEVIDGKRHAAFTVSETRMLQPVTIKEGFYQYGELDDPCPFTPAWAVYSGDTGAMLARSFWKMGLLNDPAPEIPAIMKFVSIYDTLYSHNESFGLKNPPVCSKDAVAEKYRAYFSMGVMRDPAQEPAEQWRNPYDGQIYCAHSAGRNKYLTPDELKALNGILKSSASTTSPSPKNKPNPPFTFRI